MEIPDYMLKDVDVLGTSPFDRETSDEDMALAVIKLNELMKKKRRKRKRAGG